MGEKKDDDEVDDTSNGSNDVSKSQHYKDSSTCVVHGGNGSFQCLAKTSKDCKPNISMATNIIANVSFKSTAPQCKSHAM